MIKSLSPSLQAFKGVVSNLDMYLGQSLESLWLNMVCRDRIENPESLQSQILEKLPFNQSYDGSMSLLFCMFLESKESFLNGDSLDEFARPKKDLIEGYEFWKKVMSLLHHMHQEHRDALFDEFVATDEWVKSKVMNAETLSLLTKSK